MYGLLLLTDWLSKGTPLELYKNTHSVSHDKHTRYLLSKEINYRSVIQRITINFVGQQ